MNNVTKSYNVSKKKSSEKKMKKKKEDIEYKVVREYKKLFSCYELIARIIENHNKEDIDLINNK